MSAHSVSRTAPVTNREIITLFLPLALTSTMMSISGPLINAGIARMPEPTAGLAAFGLAFSLSIFLESPVFALQQSVVAWYPGAGPIRPYVSFSFAIGVLLFLWGALVAFSPVAPWVLSRLMSAPPELIPTVVDALRVGILFPLFIAVRLAFQGILVVRRNSGPIAVGTLLRLLLLGVLIILVCPRLDMAPPVSATAALAAAVLVETIYVMFAVRRTPELHLGGSPAEEAGRTFPGRVQFYLPLAGTMVLGTLTNPLINAFLSRTSEPETALAVYAVVSSLVWFLTSSTLRFSTVTIAMGSTVENLRRLGLFLWKVVGGITAVVVLVTVTPILPFILKSLMGLQPGLASLVRAPLAILGLQPLVAAFLAYNQGILTRNAHTDWVGLGAVSRLLSILTLGILGLRLGWPGPLLGGVLLGASFAAEYATLLALRQWGGRPSAVPPGARGTP